MNWIKYSKLYLFVSTTLIVISLYSIFTWGFRLGVDFTGGALVEYKFSEKISTEDVSAKLSENYEVASIQDSGDGAHLIKFASFIEDKEKTKEFLTDNFGEVEELRFENVGPSVGPELVKKTAYAILTASGLILFWVALQFKSLKYGFSAIAAMFHDSFVLLGSFSLMGKFLGAEVDFLFVTALLTTLSFSVHDTIVVFDRIREQKSEGDIKDTADRAITETMVRSLNNSFTIIFMLVALVLLGGTTVKWFAVALLVGTVLGTYSSPFVAVPLLVKLSTLKKD